MPRTKMQFTLSSLFGGFVLVALSMAVFGPCGVVVGPILLLSVVYVRNAGSLPTVVGFLCLAAVAGVVLWFLLLAGED
jgi:hypothetical protein